MENEFDIEKTKAFAWGFFQGAQFVMQYMKDQHSAIEGVLAKSEIHHRDEALKGLWMRAYAWMQTIGKLNDPLDFQAILSGNRALLELVVDMSLLYHDKTNTSGWKIFQWNVSEKKIRRINC